MRVRWLDNVPASIATSSSALLAERLSQFVGMADYIKDAARRAETLALLARAMDTLRADE